MNLPDICHNAVKLAEQSARFLRQELGNVRTDQIEEKALNSLVSYVDKATEAQLVAGLRSITPGCSFLTEEDTVENTEGSLRWIVDPLDGTTNFLFQLPVFSISLALEREGEIVLGIVYEVNQQEAFYAWKDSGAYLNGKPIRVSKRPTLPQSLLATGFPYYNYDQTQAYLKALQFFMQHTRGIRRFGSAAVDLAYVACGRFDGFFEYSLQPYDVAGGAFIVQEAGGVVTDFRGGTDWLHGGEMLASNALIAEDFLEVVRSAFKS
ncbi:MAG: inositol monophosphatase family protein [Phaeodactylibacter sp.]|uniref:inositol monophosphatase family protein n=1 Tax=Phaeodactylibacter sp. TaxID=1940289 RepID=UPI0032EE3221